ncbi:MAG: DinB family protein [Phycisphaeraceae bacterium]|nr:DinB family protein [Phycisphaeraceae bacterium]
MTTTTAAPSTETLESLSSLTNEQLLERYRWGVENLSSRIFELSDDQLDTAFLPDAEVGAWPVRDLCGHLADAEMAFTHRIRRALAEDGPTFEPWDEHAFIDSGTYRNAKPGGFVAVVYTLRVWLGELLESLTPQQWQRSGMHPQYGALTIRHMVEVTTWHLERHAWFLNRKVEKMLGPEPECPEDTQGGCGPGCGCRH